MDSLTTPRFSDPIAFYQDIVMTIAVILLIIINYGNMIKNKAIGGV